MLVNKRRADTNNASLLLKSFFTNDFKIIVMQKRHKQDIIKFALKMPSSKMAWVE
jgi:hypothetical protein